MQLFVGLGNPGSEYALHRHNVGFMAANSIAEAHGFGPWGRKFHGLVADGRIGGVHTVLLKPQTFMNDSGRSVGEAMRFYKLEPGDVTVFYDDLDLAPCKVKVKTGGGAAGHNGIRSIASHIGDDFRRVRIGIGHPGDKARVTGYVLGNYARTELKPLAGLLAAIAAEARWLAEGNDARFMSDVALRLKGDVA